MRIAAFSLAPIFPNHVHGGSQKILRQILYHLGAKDHTVRVVCVSRPDNMDEFVLCQNVRVLPCLRLKPTYPEPYYTSPVNLASLVATVKELVEWSDVFYIHDAEMPFHDLYAERPAVVSFRDLVYPDTLVGAFGFRRDLLILNSPYIARCVRDAFSPILPGIDERISVVKNGIDLKHYRPRRNSPGPRLSNLLGRIPDTTHTLIYPHRPDRRKGLIEALHLLAAVAPGLAKRGRTVRLLVPIWMDSQIAPDSEHEYQTIYQEAAAMAGELGVASSVVLHPWIPQDLMPDYYSMADATICIGNFVEAFGNAHVESVACGTPVLVSNVAAQATILPDEFVNRVPFGDVAATAEILQRILAGDQVLDVSAARGMISEDFSCNDMCEQYERILKGALISRPLSVQIPPPLSPTTQISLPAWCRFDSTGLYNDYQYGREADPELVKLAQLVRIPKTLEQLHARGFHLETVRRGLREGTLARGVVQC